MKKIKIYKNQGFYRINIPKWIANEMKLENEVFVLIEQKDDETIIIKKYKKNAKKC